MQANFAVALSRRGRLREETEAVHRSIDARISRADFLTTRSGYEAYVAATLQARRTVEGALSRAGAARLYPAWPSRVTTPALERDAVDLGLNAGPAFDEGAPLVPMLGAGAVWGALYVLEGSALGARILQRRAAAIGMTGAFGARHLDLQVRNASGWSAFIEGLNGAVLAPGEEADCLRTAVATFHAFELAYGEGAG